MNNMRIVIFGVLLWEIGLYLSSASGVPQGFISIDCGSPEESYVDSNTSITYISDSKLMEFGETRSADSGQTNGMPKYLRSLRTFPEGKRNCYTLKPETSGASKYLLRTSFFYWNFDGFNSFPRFDLYLEGTYAGTINASVSTWLIEEFIVRPTRGRLTLCLCKTNERDPFISAIELRPLTGGDIYPVVNDTLALFNLYRSNFGTLDGKWYRYPDDDFDRFWWSPASNGLGSIKTTADLHQTSSLESVSSTESPYVPPSVVMQTADINPNASRGIKWSSTTIPQGAYLFLCIHFAELQNLQPNEIREFDITVDSNLWQKAFRPRNLTTTSICSKHIYRSQKNLVEYTPIEASTLSPIVNAMELYSVLLLSGATTNDADASSLVDIRDKYNITKPWTGDPCVPLNYTWEGLVCSNGTTSPRVLSLDLSNSGLSGEIPKSLASFSAVVKLNLSGNNLTGNIPIFLATDLPQLKMLDLSNNDLSGCVPDDLLRRKDNKSFTFSFSGNVKLSSSSSCNASKSKRKAGVIAGIAAAAVLLTLNVFWLAAFMVMKRRKSATRAGGSSNGCQAFTHEEVIKATNNFSRKIGEGGYGSVFHGRLESGRSVAVKILSSKSKQGSKEFRTEVILLSRVHHKNQVSLIGYCDEEENMILIYEYISRGNLQDVLSGRSERILDWNERLKVAFGAAQGLDYLHSGCNPGIVHRDVKSANILLNERLEAKIADFGMSKADFHEGVTHISTKVVGTPGYLDPEYYLTNHLNEKSDVYSFGIVLLELVSGLQPIITEPSGERVNIVKQIRPKLLRGDIASVADPRFCGAYDASSMWKVAEIALECTALKAIERPTMSMVVSYLKEAIESGLPTIVSMPGSPSEPLRGAYAFNFGMDTEASVICSAPSAR